MKQKEEIKILVVEDELLNAAALKQELEVMGYKVFEIVTRGKTAIEKALSLKPDIILMDIYLANDINGIDAAREIQKKFAVPVLYISAYIDNDTIEKSRETNSIGFIQKPFEITEVDIKIKDYFLSRAS
ncbi:MAG: response regulator [Candidatus Aminicenantes bacterium]|nr:response regulator [Candidatus Aminicenantes bacterium]NIM85181.1 response regulator [Candidatus Aminicenantes bacterium]NIN24711.1 response regulator [Candidatus Aminicenantes bacterium]NIN48469.1 response regulator [Candidatus Aminicenantes bacterium]NIN91369.1 response regulator [Candidatus Aminicenantes bacterium]